MEVDSVVSRAAIERDLRCYADQWKKPQEAEAESAYDFVYTEPADIQELNRRGSCIHDVTLRRGMDSPPLLFVQYVGMCSLCDFRIHI